MMARRTNTTIQKPHLILCEGRDAEEFLISYLNSNALSKIEFFSNDIQVMDFGGNEQLPAYLNSLKMMDGFSNVKSIAIIRDAERSTETAITQIKSAFKNSGITCPEKPCFWETDSIKVGFLLFPSVDKTPITGTLEDLCLSILSEDSKEILNEIDSFIKKLQDEFNRNFPHEFKTKLHTYFSITDKYVSMKVGEASKSSAFNWEHERLNSLKNFLLELIS